MDAFCSLLGVWFPQIEGMGYIIMPIMIGEVTIEFI